MSMTRGPLDAKFPAKIAVQLEVKMSVEALVFSQISMGHYERTSRNTPPHSEIFCFEHGLG